MRGNLITGSSSQGLVVANSSGIDFVNNTVTGNGVGSTNAVAQSAAITLRSTASNTTIDRNIVQANYGTGIQVNDGASGTVITQNSFAANGTIVARSTATLTDQIGIDLNVSGDDNNLGTPDYFSINTNVDSLQDFPILETAVISGSNLTLTGWSKPLASIEVFIAAPDPHGFGEGETYIGTFVEGTADADSDVTNYTGLINGINQGTDTTNRFSFTVAIASLASPVVASDQLTATATMSGETSEFSGLVTLVVNDADLVLTKVLDPSTPGPFAEGDTVTYLLTVTNNGPGQASSVTATDTYPAQLTLGTATPSAPTTYNSGTGVWDIGTLAVSASETLTLTGTVNASTAGDVVTNSVTAPNSDQTDPDGRRRRPERSLHGSAFLKHRRCNAG